MRMAQRKDGSIPEAPGDGEDWLGDGELAAHTEQSCEWKEEGLSLSQAENSKPIRITQWCGLRIVAPVALTFASDATNAARCDTW